MPFDRAGNRMKDAQNIKLASRNRGLKDWIGGADRDDYYSFRLRKSSNLTLRLSKLKADANLELLNRKGNVLERSTRSKSKRESIKLNDLDAGKYYVRVYRHRGNTRYKLNFKAEATENSLSTNSKNDSVLKLHPFVQRVFELTNVQRSRAGLQPLSFDADLGRAAQNHSASMANNDFFSHTGVDGSSSFDRINAQGYRYRFAAENIAAGFSTPEAVVDAWMNSPSHRVNILNGNLTEIGIGYHYLANDTGSVNYNTYWTQNFGTPFN